MNPDEDVNRLLVDNPSNIVGTVDHCLMPAFNKNLGCGEEKQDGLLSWYPSCYMGTPLPILISGQHTLNEDICLRRPMRQETYTKLLARTRSTYLRSLSINTSEIHRVKIIYRVSVLCLHYRGRTE